MADPLRLYGLKALVINAGSGIGEASARTLIKHGATVLAVDSINSGVEQHFKAVKGIEGYSANLTDSTLMPGLVEEAVKRLGQIDILINDFPLRADAPLVDGEMRGAPALFGRQTWPELLSLRGDMGGRSLLRRHASRVSTVSTVASTLLDIDTPRDHPQA